MTKCLPVRRRRGSTGAIGANALPRAILACVILAGCKTGIDASAIEKKNDEQIAQTAAADDVKGPLERLLSWRKKDEKTVLQLVNPPAAMADYHKAEELMKEKKYREAEKAFWATAKKYQKYPIREDAVFMSAECAFLTQRYPTADDRYSLVIKENQTTRHLDEISRRKFDIARIWLGFPDIITAKDVQPVNFEQPSATPPPRTTYQAPSGITYSVPILPNLTDSKRPLFDTKGRALEALKSIWLNDPTGPLADDALMLSASYYLREGDWVEADHLYELLRKEFNKSPHLENAYVLGAHCKLMSYQGPEYDSSELDEAKKLMQATLRLYPNRPDRARIEADLARIEKAKAAHRWEEVKFWRSKGYPRGVANYCKLLIKEYPNSDYAILARQELAKLKPEDKEDAPLKKYEESSKTGKTVFRDGSDSTTDPDLTPNVDSPGEPPRMPNSNSRK